MPDRRGATVLDDLPESIIIEEILLRLPPKDVLRCRAVRTSWRRATSTHKFMLEHHLRQPSLPVIDLPVGGKEGRLVVFRDAGAGASNQKLWPFLRYADFGSLQAACDGLLIAFQGFEFYICNPATRKCARLPQPRVRTGSGTRVVGLYRHHPSGEYRVLWVSKQYALTVGSDEPRRIGWPPVYVLTVGSDEPRRIGWPPVSSPSMEQALLKGLPYCSSDPPVYHRGSLHWELGRYSGVVSDIMVFDTAVEAFRWMRHPARLGRWVSLFEMSGTLALCSTTCSDGITQGLTMDVWVMQDFEAETWAFKYRINLSSVEASPPLDLGLTFFPKVAVLNERELLIQFTPVRVLRCDINGKFLGNVEIEGDEVNMWLTRHRLQESIIPFPFREMQEDEESPFFIGL